MATTPETVSRELLAKIEDRRVPAPGVFRGIPAHDYHNWRAASYSMLQQLKRSPAHAKHYLDTTTEPTPAMIFGSAAHAAILEPDLFGGLYVSAPEGDKRTKAVKDAWDQLSADRPGATILRADDFNRCLALRDAVHGHATAAALLKGAGDVEFSFAWEHQIAGVGSVLCKGRADRVSWEVAGGTIVDLKTTRDARRQAFERSIFAMGYYNQGAMYVDGVRAQKLAIKHYTTIAVESEAPFAVAVYRMRDEVIEAGRIENADLLALYARCALSGTWPGYTDEITDIGLPDWAWRTIEEGIA